MPALTSLHLWLHTLDTMFFHTGLQVLVPQWDICLNIKFYMVYTMHCDTTITIKTNKMHSCYNSILKKTASAIVYLLYLITNTDDSP